MIEYQKPIEREEDVNRARLAVAARKMLCEAQGRAISFGMSAALLWGKPNGDAVIAGMIEFAIRLAKMDKKALDTSIEEQSGMKVDIQDPTVGGVGIRSGYLVAIEGTDTPPGSKGFLKGQAVVTDRVGRENFIPVGVLESGIVFARLQK